MLLKPAFENYDVHYATTIDGLAQRSGLLPARIVPDFNAKQPLKTLLALGSIISVVVETRPDVIVSTGAAPGVVALFVGKLCGAKVIWIDSIANSERLSLSGRLASRFADMCLTQWSHLSRPNGPQFLGAVL